MKAKLPERMRQGKVRESNPRFQTGAEDFYGRFIVKAPTGAYLLLVVSRGDPEEWVACGFDLPAWEHVSVSVRGAERCPTWEEMCFVKDLCWEPEECVVQFHPRRSQYVNHHPYVLHLWLAVGVAFPTPPALAVGPLARTPP